MVSDDVVEDEARLPRSKVFPLVLKTARFKLSGNTDCLDGLVVADAIAEYQGLSIPWLG